MLLTSLETDRQSFKAGTGWDVRPEGACKGSLCIPLKANEAETLDIVELATALGMPLVKAEEFGIWSLGPESIQSKALTTAEAPELILPDLEGREFKLSSLKGKKIIVYAWAPY